MEYRHEDGKGKAGAIRQAVQALETEFARFEADHVAWAVWLMEGGSGSASGSEGDVVSDDGDDAVESEDGSGRESGRRRFVKEGMEILSAVERARGEVERVAARLLGGSGGREVIFRDRG